MIGEKNRKINYKMYMYNIQIELYLCIMHKFKF